MKYYKLIGKDGKQYLSKTKGLYGGNKSLKIYGTLECKNANTWVKKGFYVKHRVFFASIEDAVSAGYRACKKCLGKYKGDKDG
jgi:methylphosphotriester-DNA--protein-cysteine methyltransferase